MIKIIKKQKSAITKSWILSVVLVTLPSPVQGLTLVTSRTDLGGNDQLNWSSLGQIFIPPPDAADFLPNSLEATSVGGLGVNATFPLPNEPSITPPFVFQTSSGGVETNFADGDFILFSGFNPNFFPAPGNPGPLSITFAQPVLGGGTQIAVDDTNNFIASISAFDEDGLLLDTFSAPGTSSLEVDNSALFLGVLSETPNIKQLVFNTSVPNRAIGINSLSIVSTSVPEPVSTIALGLVGLSLLSVKKKKC